MAWTLKLQGKQQLEERELDKLMRKKALVSGSLLEMLDLIFQSIFQGQKTETKTKQQMMLTKVMMIKIKKPVMH